ncbi:MAG: hypothetical protein M3137_01020 [Actinomycetota bacterium]|nr:hypothetical protein [Actinomycetota bacterium]
MSHVFYSLAILACPLGMGLMMWMMMRAGKGRSTTQPDATVRTAPELNDRYAQQARLDQLEAENAELRGRQVAAHPAPQDPTEQ